MVAIKNMEHVVPCIECRFNIRARCVAADEKCIIDGYGRMPWCPLVSVEKEFPMRTFTIEEDRENGITTIKISASELLDALYDRVEKRKAHYRRGRDVEVLP